MRGIAAAICLAVLGLFVPQANASGDTGICVVVHNQTTALITVRVTLPSAYSNLYWELLSGETVLLTFSNDVPIVTTGERDVQGNIVFLRATGSNVDANRPITFDYQSDRNNAAGCNGSFVATVHGR